MPAGSLRLGQVVHVATADEFPSDSYAYGVLHAAGLTDDQMRRDGSVVGARAFCCGGPVEKANPLYVYVPEGMQADIGDVIEIWSGQMVGGREDWGPWPNTLVGVREKAEEFGNECRWLPDNPDLWLRELYCDGLEEEGWLHQTGIFPLWYKKLPDATPPSH